MGRVAVITCLLVSALIQEALAYPKLWAGKTDTCVGPSQEYKGHVSPVVQDSDLKFELFQEDGTPVATYEPGASYLLNVTYPLLGNMYLHATGGAFDNSIDPQSGTPVQKENCNLRAWYSDELYPVQVKSVNWQAPSCCDSAPSVTVQATYASGPSVRLRQAEVDFQRTELDCSCKEEVAPSTPLLPESKTPKPEIAVLPVEGTPLPEVEQDTEPEIAVLPAEGTPLPDVEQDTEPEIAVLPPVDTPLPEVEQDTEPEIAVLPAEVTPLPDVEQDSEPEIAALPPVDTPLPEAEQETSELSQNDTEPEDVLPAAETETAPVEGNAATTTGALLARCACAALVLAIV